MLLEQVQQASEIEQGAAQAIDPVDHDDVDVPGRDVGGQVLEGAGLIVVSRELGRLGYTEPA